MSNADRVLSFLQSIAPKAASNAEIGRRTGVRPHAQVFQITRKLEERGLIAGRLYGSEWEYWSTKRSQPQIQQGSAAFASDVSQVASVAATAAREFEAFSRSVFERKFATPLREKRLDGIPKRWDFVSDDCEIVGDAKFYTLVNGVGFPPAKMSVISEHVWLLSKVGARQRFLVFGNELQVPRLWLDKHGHLTEGIQFWFLHQNGTLDLLHA
ncbi:hypothetical protein RB623_10105 [Mesorhizobium sp. LHD-90]|uniref:hypothetical protein n=1 Tax=Mesorhizobium sp. LHD-90 TaxID=3071414 RepID=UPI0027DEF4E1|nr:hypothetical protein [Mesorhizobium sp. LHD-90]MDQ6434400.1 hypothetical protein [Mesorhizobium sp. LHD-90]